MVRRCRPVHVYHLPNRRRTSTPSGRILQIHAHDTGARLARVDLEGEDSLVAMPSGFAYSRGSRGRGMSAWELRLARAPDSPRSLGKLSSACAVDDRLYGIGEGGLVRHTPDLPAHDLTPVWLGDETVITRCDRHGGEDIVWLSGQVLGVAPQGDVAWSLELGPWSPWAYPGDPAELPAVPVVGAAGPGANALLLLDLERHVVRRAVAIDHVHDVTGSRGPRRSHIRIQPDEASADTVLITVDGATGEVSAAVALRDGENLSVLEEDSPFRGLPHLLERRDDGPGRRLVLDAATLTPLGPVDEPPPDALAQARTLLGRDATVPPIRGPQPRLARRGRGPGPPWSTATLIREARRYASAGDAPAQILLWDRHEEKDDGWAEHALVALEHPDDRGRPTWTALLMRRGNREDWALPPGWRSHYFYAGEEASRVSSVGGTEEWHPFERNDRTRQLRRFWRRPTDADLQRLLASNDRWDFSGHATTFFTDEPIGPDDRATVADGNVIDTAWLAVTGEPPSRHYAAPIERPDELTAASD